MNMCTYVVCVNSAYFSPGLDSQKFLQDHRKRDEEAKEEQRKRDDEAKEEQRKRD